MAPVVLMLRHMNDNNPKQAGPVCEWCGKPATRRNIHSGEHACDSCPEGNVYGDYLNANDGESYEEFAREYLAPWQPIKGAR